MKNELDPRIDQWYAHLDKGQCFYVTAIDEEQDTIEIQHFDGDLEEIDMDEWRKLAIELCEQPENWSGALDIAEQDDLGTGITDTDADDWTDAGEDFRRRNK
jgi:5,10-methenyltetrahydromethanopterin hydrogenase